jgi:flagellar biosynthesis chaperone FliJ
VLLEENSRLSRGLQTEKSKTDILRESMSKKDRIIQQLRFIAQFSHAVMQVHQRQLSTVTTGQEMVNTDVVQQKLLQAAAQCDSILSQYDPAAPTTLYAGWFNSLNILFYFLF